MRFLEYQPTSKIPRIARNKCRDHRTPQIYHTRSFSYSVAPCKYTPKNRVNPKHQTWNGIGRTRVECCEYGFTREMIIITFNFLRYYKLCPSCFYPLTKYPPIHTMTYVQFFIEIRKPFDCEDNDIGAWRINSYDEGVA